MRTHTHIYITIYIAIYILTNTIVDEIDGRLGGREHAASTVGPHYLYTFTYTYI